MKFQKGGHLGFFQVVFRSKNVARQSCRSMQFQKGGHLGFFRIPKRRPSWIFSNSVWIQKCCQTKLQIYEIQKMRPSWIFRNSKKAAILDFFKQCLDPEMAARQSCRSMKFQKGCHLGFFKIDYQTARWLLDGCYTADQSELLDGCQMAARRLLDGRQMADRQLLDSCQMAAAASCQM